VLGAIFLILGVTVLIGLTIRGGQLTDLELKQIAPWFGSMRWLLPFLLLPLGYYLERANGEHWDWQLTVLGAAVAYVAAVGIVGLIDQRRAGTIGRAVADFLAPLVTTPGAALILIFLVVGGFLLAVDMSLPAAVAPVARLFGKAFSSLFRPAPKLVPGTAGSTSQGARGAERLEKAAREAAGPAPGQRFRPSDERTPSIPVAVPIPGPISQTFAPSATPATTFRDGGPLRESGAPRDAGPAAASFLPGAGSADGPAQDAGSVRDGVHARGQRGIAGSTDGSPAASTLDAAGLTQPRREYRLPPLALLEDIAPRNGDSTMDPGS
jgi:hypothetical protein